MPIPPLEGLRPPGPGLARPYGASPLAQASLPEASGAEKDVAVEKVILEDHTLRDGLQAQPRVLGLERRAELLAGLAAAGFRRVQAVSFVSPRRLPQMAGAEELLERLGPGAAGPGLELSGLALNPRGLERALACGLKRLSVTVSASDAHSLINVGRPAGQALAQALDMIRQAVSAGVWVRGGVQCAYGCAYEGAVPPKRVLGMLEALAGAGAGGLCLADTAAKGRPRQVARLVEAVARALPGRELSLHLHGPAPLCAENLAAAWRAGARCFDVSLGGLGGCPALPRPLGNLPAGLAIKALEGLGAPTGLDAELLKTLERRLRVWLGQAPRLELPAWSEWPAWSRGGAAQGLSAKAAFS